MTAGQWQEVRNQFPALQGWTYLNTATFGQLPQRATAAVAGHFAHRDELACSDFLHWFNDADRIRGVAAKMINAQPSDIAFFPNACTVLSLLIRGMKWQDGDEILSLAGEFPNQLYAPAAASGADVVAREVAWDGFYEALTPRTRLVALSTVNYATGFRPPVEEIGRELRKRGILFYLDGTQSLGALRFDVAVVQPDVFAVHGYKWLLSPTGAAFGYFSPSVREWLPPGVIGWRSDQDWRSVNHLHHGQPRLMSDAERYEGGMLMFPVLYAMEQSMLLMQEIGTDVIETRVMELTEQTRQLLRDQGASLLSDQGPHYGTSIMAAQFPHQEAGALALALREHKILVSARHGNLRVSVHFYNNEEDLSRLAQGLRRVMATTRS